MGGASSGMTDATVVRSEYLMSVVTDTTNHENGVGLIVPARQKSEDGRPQGSPLQEVGRGLFSEESLMSVVIDTTKH